MTVTVFRAYLTTFRYAWKHRHSKIFTRTRLAKRLAFLVQAETFNLPAADLALGSRPARVLVSGFCGPIFTVCLPFE